MTDVVFAPTELALLFGDRFAGEGSLLKGKEELLTTGAVVAANALAVALLEVAFLGLERTGHLRLELQERKVLFGLSKRTAVHATHLGGDRLPLGVLERRLVEAAMRGPADVNDVIHRFFGRDLSLPHAEVLTLVKAGLHERGLADAEREKTMLVFSTVRYRLTEPARHAAAHASPDAALALLRDADARPGLRAALRKEIDAGILRRTESSD